MSGFGSTAGVRGLVVAAVLAAAGCAGKGDLTGTVTYKGQPLRLGAVQVRGADGIVRAGQIGPDGWYTVPGLPAGPAVVAVVCRDPRQVEYTQTLARGARGPARVTAAVPPAPGRSPNFSLIPEKYADLDKPELRVTVRGGTTAFDIELK